jgi:hypothetical protein
MGKRKRKLSAAEKAAKKKRRQEFQTVFINGKMKRIRRPPTIEGMSVEEFVRKNADPVFLHEEEMWEYIEVESEMNSARHRTPTVSSTGRELVSFITIEDEDNLIVAYAIELGDPDEVASVILLRTPKFEFLLGEEERGVSVSHELYSEVDGELARRIVVDGSQVNIESTIRTYRLDLSRVDPEEATDAKKVLRRMHRYGGFMLDIK